MFVEAEAAGPVPGVVAVEFVPDRFINVLIGHITFSDETRIRTSTHRGTGDDAQIQLRAGGREPFLCA